MKKKDVYIIRHGETDQNRLGIVQGRGIDSYLNETGHWQSNAFYQHYKFIDFDRIYCSSQLRSFQTIQKFEKDNRLIYKDERIDEINWGEHEGKAGDPDLMVKYDRIIQSWASGNYHDGAEGGESAHDLYVRLKPFIEDLQNEEFNTALICTHGRTMRAMICLLKNLPLRYMEQIKHQNTGLYQAVYHQNNWQIIAENDCTHLIQNPVF
jgi:broad specificity phosphatase PhoE